MAKTRAQRKAERRRREARQAQEAQQERRDESRAQERTQVPESADVVEAEIAETGADLDELRDEPAETPAEQSPQAPAPSRADVGTPAEGDKIGRRAQKREEREKRQRAKESEARRQKLLKRTRATRQERQGSDAAPLEFGIAGAGEQQQRAECGACSRVADRS